LRPIGREVAPCHARIIRQNQEGSGTKVIDRLAGDLRRAYPDMIGLSPRNLKYMRAIAEAWPEESIVRQEDRRAVSTTIARATASAV
jgi:DUF1016 N-terminal domain